MKPHSQPGDPVPAGRQRGLSRYALPLICVFAATVAASLGLWQGRRLEARRARNAAAEARRALPALSLNEAEVEAESLSDREVIAHGSYDHGRTVILRGRVDRSAPGVYLVTPLLLDGRAEAVLVLRGFVPAPDALRPDPLLIDQAERALVTGVTLPIPVTPDSGSPLLINGLATRRRLDLGALRAELPYPILDHYVHATSDSAEDGRAAPFPQPVDLAPLDDGPHLSYMIQWFGIAAVALGFGVAVWRRGREGVRP